MRGISVRAVISPWQLGLDNFFEDCTIRTGAYVTKSRCRAAPFIERSPSLTSETWRGGLLYLAITST